MKDIEIIVKALKCSASPGRHDCDGCFYEYVEPLPEAFKNHPELTAADGMCHSCDVDQIALDATEALEQLTKEANI